MPAADTNVLVRLLTGDDSRQTAIAEAYIRFGAWASTLAIAESVWVLRTYYRRSHADLAAAVEMLLSAENLIIQDSDAVASALELYRSLPALGFSDCLMLELARKSGHLPLGTFDRRLGQVEGAEQL